MPDASAGRSGDAGDLATRDDVLTLVRAFYREAAVDDLLAPIFHAAHVDWAEHVPKVTDFWCWQLLGATAETRNTLAAHEASNAFVPFTDALRALAAIWTSTARRSVPRGPVAEVAKERLASPPLRAMQRYLSTSGPGNLGAEVRDASALAHPHRGAGKGRHGRAGQ
ncbi:MAG: group III truncated hemoglobin [Acidimicrobiia bacterium]